MQLLKSVYNSLYHRKVVNFIDFFIITENWLLWRVISILVPSHVSAQFVNKVSFSLKKIRYFDATFNSKCSSYSENHFLLMIEVFLILLALFCVTLKSKNKR